MDSVLIYLENISRETDVPVFYPDTFDFNK